MELRSMTRSVDFLMGLDGRVENIGDRLQTSSNCSYTASTHLRYPLYLTLCLLINLPPALKFFILSLNSSPHTQVILRVQRSHIPCPCYFDVEHGGLVWPDCKSALGNESVFGWYCCWDPISPICIMNHVRHLRDTFATIWDDSRSTTTKDDKKMTLCNHLRCLIPFYNTLQCSLSLLQPFLTFSDAFRPFATFLDFALFNTPPICIAFSGTFHQPLFTSLVHQSFGFSAIISVRSALCFTDISRFSLLL